MEIYYNVLCVLDELRVDYIQAWGPQGRNWLKAGPETVYLKTEGGGEKKADEV